MKNTKDLNSLLEDVLGMDPMLEYTEPLKESDKEMMYGLAQMFADKGFRRYMENEINRAIKNAALASDTELLGAVFKGRIITLRELYAKSRKAFTELDRIKELQKKHAANSKGQENTFRDAETVRL